MMWQKKDERQMAEAIMLGYIVAGLSLAVLSTIVVVALHIGMTR